jgi:hypothetical protein
LARRALRRQTKCLDRLKLEAVTLENFVFFG